MKGVVAKNDFGFYISGPKSEGFAYVIVNAVPDLPSEPEPSVDSKNHSNFGLEDLPLDLLAETLRYELPQTCALALQMMSRESAATVLKMLPWELQQDVGIRHLTMGNVNAVTRDLLVQACRG